MKPIAWIDKNTGKPRMEGFIQTDHDIPLYTTPQTKPLSNDEIREIGDDCVLKNNGILNWIDFARAIEERLGLNDI